MSRRVSAAITAFFVLVAGEVFAAESAYSKIDLEQTCTFHSEYEQGASAYCEGYKGYPIHFSEGDLRQMVRFGHVGKLDGQWQSFGQFNRINNTVEWRLENKKPYAAILRWFIENTNDEGATTTQTEGQVLVISTVADHAKPVSCVVGYVDAKANNNANDIARNIADTLARDFKCRSDTPSFHGIRGEKAGDPVIYFE